MSQTRVDPEIVILEGNHCDLETNCNDSLPPAPPPTPTSTSSISLTSTSSLYPTSTSSLSPTSTLPLFPSSIINYEQDVDSSNEPKGIYFMSDELDVKDVVKLDSVLAAVPCETLDIGLLGDTSEENSTSPTSNSDVDPELPRNDYLNFEKCLLCKTEKKNSSYPYCWRCFALKKNLFPKRAGRYKNQFKIFEMHNEIENNNSRFQNSTVETSIPNSALSWSISGSNSLEMCRVCFLKPENGLFVHSSTAHLYGCYACAKKIWCHTGGCPICRTKIFKVVKLYA